MRKIDRCDWLDNVDCSRIEENGGGKSHEKEDEDFKEEEVEETTKRIKTKNKPTKSTTVVVETTHVASTVGIDPEFEFDAKTSKG